MPGVRTKYVGLLLVLLSAATFSTSGSFADALLATGWSPGAAVTTRICAAAVMLTVPAVLSLRGKWHTLKAQWPLTVVYGVLAVGGCQLFFFNALEHLSVGVALLLEYSGSVLVVLWLWLRHGHRPRWLTVVGAGLSVVGLVLVLDVVRGAHVDLVGVLWGLGAAVGLAAFYVISSNGDSEVPPLGAAWAGMVIGGAVLLLAGAAQVIPMHASTQQVHLAGTDLSWVVPILGLSFIAAVIAYTAGISGARLLGAKVASFVGLTEVLFAIAFAYLLVDQHTTAIQAVGGAVVIAGIVLVRADELKDDL
jgi:drug/metabolite transporter (DMT)-like permease